MYNESAVASGITPVGSFDSGVGEGGSEVVAFNATTSQLYVTNGAQDRIDVVDAGTLSLVTSLDLTGIANYDSINSVATNGALIAVAVDLADDESGAVPVPRDGVIAVFDAADLSAAPTLVPAGNHPDMVTFSRDGTKIFAANEGEAEDVYDTQPLGGITVIDAASLTGTTIDFTSFDGQEDALRAAGVRIFEGESVSTDVEPEYIAESEDGSTLFVTLQEANAVAVFDIASGQFTGIQPLGTSDHSQTGAAIDPSDRDDAIAIKEWPVMGMRMPDTIASFSSGGTDYYLTANEGDDRGEDVRIADIDLDPTAFPDAVRLQKDQFLGRLGVSSVDGDTDGDGDFDELHSYGSRSFSIYDETGALVFDSGRLFEDVVASLRPANAFNNDDFPTDDPDVIDENRSDNKGPEPEAIATGQIDGIDFIFVGAERDGGIFVMRADDPAAPELAAYIDSSAVGDVSPEIITVIDAADSGTGTTQLAISYEISGTTSLIDLSGAVDAQASQDGDLTGSLVEDIIRGGEGTNSLWGGGSSDIINGRAGDDVITGGFGDDLLIGRAGNDMFRFDLYEGRDVIADFADGDMIDLSLTGEDFSDVTIREIADTRTIVRIRDDLKIVVLHDDTVTVDEADFLFS